MRSSPERRLGNGHPLQKGTTEKKGDKKTIHRENFPLIARVVRTKLRPYERYALLGSIMLVVCVCWGDDQLPSQCSMDREGPPPRDRVITNHP